MAAMSMVRKQEDTSIRRPERSAAKLSIIVGENLRTLRRKHGLSLEQLAHLSGVSRAMLGQIETGKSAPTINLLARIAGALNVSVSSLISSPDHGGTVIVPRDRSTVVTSSEGGFTCRALFPWGDPQSAEIYEVTIAGRHVQSFAAHAPGVKKTLVVLSGTVEVTIGEVSPSSIAEGDTILFNADAPHKFYNPGESEAKAFLIITGNEALSSRTRSL